MNTKRTRLSIPLDVELVKEARALGLDLSRVLEARLRDTVREERHRRWLDENREAFEAANRFIETFGIFNAEDREW